VLPAVEGVTMSLAGGGSMVGDSIRFTLTHGGEPGRMVRQLALDAARRDEHQLAANELIATVSRLASP
jgi:hypothetical protein